jgi:thioredoxin family protein
MHDFAGALGVNSYPTMLIFDEKAAPIFPIVGYMTATQLEPLIKFAGNNTYLTVTTQEAYDKYLKTFKGTFKN